GHIFGVCHVWAMAARACELANPDDAECQRDHWRARANCSRALPMDAAKRCLPQVLPGTITFHPTAWRVSTGSVRLAAPWISAWLFFCWVLLGPVWLVFFWRGLLWGFDCGEFPLCSCVTQV